MDGCYSIEISNDKEHFPFVKELVLPSARKEEILMRFTSSNQIAAVVDGQNLPELHGKTVRRFNCL